MDQDKPTRLSGWKEIADYLRVEKTTAQRWEKERNLPIQRPSGSGGTVFADTQELDRWLGSAEPDRVSPAGGAGPPDGGPKRTGAELPPLGPIDAGNRPESPTRSPAPQHSSATGARSIAVPFIALATAGLVGFVLSSLTGLRPAWFPALSSAVYAGLYAVSILLETAYENRDPKLIRAVVLTYSFMFLTSIAAVAVDVQFGSSAETGGFLFSLLVFFSAGTLQWLAVRPLLPDRTIVLATFSAHTAQAAHLKNTGYFLLLVMFFWLPPIHCIGFLERRLILGHEQLVRQLLDGTVFIFARGISYPKPGWLLCLLIVFIGVSVPMGARLTENLKEHPQRNQYLNLFYGRAVLYYGLCFLVLAWYSYSLERLSASLYTAGR
jgi:hypothetical protein